MSKSALIAEANDLNRRARDLWQQSQALNVAEYKALGLDHERIGADYACAAAVPLRAEATALRARARDLYSQAEGGVTALVANATRSTIAAPLAPAVEAIVARVLGRPGTPVDTSAPHSSVKTGSSMPDTNSSERYSKAEIDAAVAAAVANFQAPTAPLAARVETVAQIAAREAEARAVETDELVARIVGDPGIVARSAAERKARQAEEAAFAADRAKAAASDPEVDAVAARIAAA